MLLLQDPKQREREQVRPRTEDEATARREWGMIAAGISVIIAVFAIVIAVVAFATAGDDAPAAPAPAEPAAAATAAPADAAAPTLEQAKGIDFEKFERVDPTLPAPVTKVDVDVFQHVTQVSKDLAPTEVWS